MYPNILTEHQRAKDVPVTKGTTIYIAGFDTFVTERDSTTFEILWDFFRRQYPESEASREDVLRCFSKMDKDCAPRKVQEITPLICFGHVLYY